MTNFFRLYQFILSRDIFPICRQLDTKKGGQLDERKLSLGRYFFHDWFIFCMLENDYLSIYLSIVSCACLSVILFVVPCVCLLYRCRLVSLSCLIHLDTFYVKSFVPSWSMLNWKNISCEWTCCKRNTNL